VKFRGADLLSRVAFGIAAIAAVIGGPASAASPAPQPAPLPASVYSWTGFYIGGNLGYGGGDDRTDVAGNGSVTAKLGGFSYPSSFGFADSNTARLNGATGGGQFGFNHQSGPKWVVGLEADIQSDRKSWTGGFADTFATPVCTSATPTGTCLVNTNMVTGTGVTDYQANIDWFGTVRGRLGFLPSSQSLIYVTGGLAYGHVAVSGIANVTAMILGPRSSTAAFNASATNVGFSAGGGMEGKFDYWLPVNWTWKLEYLYVDLGTLDAGTPFATAALIRGFPTPALSPATGTVTTHTHFTDNIVRVGLNYKFNN
jgi:outer membrane immunogenic protein